MEDGDGGDGEYQGEEVDVEDVLSFWIGAQ